MDHGKLWGTIGLIVSTLLIAGAAVWLTFPAGVIGR